MCKFVYIVFDSEPLPYKRAIQKGDTDGAHQTIEDTITSAARLELVHSLNALYRNLNFCAFLAPYETDQQIAYMFYSRYIDVAITSDTDMLVYGVPFVNTWNAITKTGLYYHQAFLRQIADQAQESLEDYFINMVVQHGCDYVRGRNYLHYSAGKLSIDENFQISPETLGKIAQDAIQAFYQFFYQPIFNLESGYVQSLLPVPQLEIEFQKATLIKTTFGDFDKRGYVPVPIDQIAVFKGKLAGAPHSANPQATWPFRSYSVF